MLPKWHILFGFVISYILIYFFNFSLVAGIITFLSSWLLIDLDHYLFYAYKRKEYNFLKFYRLSTNRNSGWWNLDPVKRAKFKFPIYIFHGIESWIILFILSIFYRFFQWVLIGFMVHMLVDLIEITFCKYVPFYVKFSQIYTFIKNKNKKTFSA